MTDTTITLTVRSGDALALAKLLKHAGLPELRRVYAEVKSALPDDMAKRLEYTVVDR